jgi:hypothetical protein
MDEAVVTRLRVIADHRPDYQRPPEGGHVDLTLYSALYRFLVDYPKGKSGLKKGELDTLHEILIYFGQPGDTDSLRLESLKQAIITVAPSHGPWTALFEPGKGIAERIVASGIRERSKSQNNTKAPDYRYAQHRYVHRMAGFIAEAVEASSAKVQDTKTAMNSEPHVTILVSRGLDERARTRYEVSIQGDAREWWLQMYRSRFGAPRPLTEVSISIDTTVRWATSDAGDFEFEMIRRFQEVMGLVYFTTPELAIEEMCRLAIQYCGHYYPQPSLVETCLESILTEAWAYRGPEDHKYYGVYSPSEKFNTPLHVPTAYLLDRAAKYGEELNWEFFARHLEWVSELDRELLVTMALPSIIREWMIISARIDISEEGLDIETFLNPAYWMLVRD